MMGLVELEAIADLGMTWDMSLLHRRLAWTSKDVGGRGSSPLLNVLPIHPVQLPGDFSTSHFHSVSLTSFKSLVNKHTLSNLWVCLAPP